MTNEIQIIRSEFFGKVRFTACVNGRALLTKANIIRTFNTEEAARKAALQAVEEKAA